MTGEEAILFAEYVQIMTAGKPYVQEFYRAAELALRAQQERENPKLITNAERIRAMSDEELALWLCDLFSVDTCYTHCPGCDSCNDAGGLSNGLKKWLQQPAEEG